LSFKLAYREADHVIHCTVTFPGNAPAARQDVKATCNGSPVTFDEAARNAINLFSMGNRGAEIEEHGEYDEDARRYIIRS
jgi:hypothetical protein